MVPAELVVTRTTSIFASTGFWALVQRIIDSKSASREMLLGLGRDKLLSRCEEYLMQGWISIEELADLEKYLYTPYKKLGGNGAGEILFSKVKNLPNKEAKNNE